MISNAEITNRLTGAGPAPAKLLAPDSPALTEKRLLNRELSLVEFFRQVLDEALDDRNPLLERLRFLTIFSGIVDEFFMVRVSGLKEEFEHGWLHPSPDGMTAEEQLREIRERLAPMVNDAAHGLKQHLLPALAERRIEIISYDSLTEAERANLDQYFTERVFPVLTPLAVDPAHPFPYISGLSLNLGLMVSTAKNSAEPGETRFIRLKVPPVLPGLIQVDPKKTRYVFLSDLIAANLESLFPGVQAGRAYAFRVTRDADLDIREDEAEDLLRALERELRKRRFGAPVRLEVETAMPWEMVEYLTQELDLGPEDVYRVDSPLNISDLLTLCNLNRPDLKFRPIRAIVPDELKSREAPFHAISHRDILLHHPYTSYSTVTNFIRTAAEDPSVLAIKICLYRTGQQSDIAEALIEAAEKGKQVTAVIELKARFDEEKNIHWAQRLEHAGVHVVYGLLGLKTHCKLTLVVRREGAALRRYVHIATGNYNPTASCTYTDFGLFTTDQDIGADASEFFNYLTGYSRQTEYRKLLISPVNLREKLMELINRETDHAMAGRDARIMAKLNRLADPKIIEALYAASDAGVQIDLIVRGVCMLRPGVPGLSENIRVRSIVGRFLEHSRIFYFANGGEEEAYIGSADWMLRNLDRRVEVVCPVENPRLRDYLKDEVLNAYLKDNVNARELQADGSYRRVHANENELFDSQIFFEGRQINS